MTTLEIKDPEAVLDYSIDWSDWLGADVISSSTWTVPSGITKDSDSSTATVAIIWLSGGTDNTSYKLTNKIVTVAGRTALRSITVIVRAGE